MIERREVVTLQIDNPGHRLSWRSDDPAVVHVWSIQDGETKDRCPTVAVSDLSALGTACMALADEIRKVRQNGS